MLLLAAVPDDRVQRLRSAEPDRYTFVPVFAWAGVIDIIRRQPIEMVVADPLLSGQPRTHEIERLRVLFPSLPLLVYTTLSPDTAGVLLELGRIGIRRAVFARFDDSPAALRLALRDELEQTASRKVIQAIVGLLEGLPSQLRRALEAMLHAPSDAATVSALADRANLQRRTCERWFARTRLPSPKMVLMLSRLLYAHRLLLDPGYTVEDVAMKLGYSKARSLQLHLKEVFGLTAGELRLSLSTEDALAIVTSRYFAEAREAVS